MKRMTRLAATLVLSLFASACIDGLGVVGDGSVGLQLAGVSRGDSSPERLGPDRRMEIGSDVLVLSSVSLVLREIELEGSDNQCDSVSSDSSSSECAEFEFGPVLVDLPLDAGADLVVTAPAPAGAYSELQFKLHKPGNDAEDAAFVNAHPDFRNASVRVTGTFNGAPFTFTSDVEAEYEVELSPALVVGRDAARLTLFVDAGRWFVTGGGSALIDPALAAPGGAFDAVVKANIRSSFQAFEDENHDGHDDHDDSGSDGTD